MQASKATEPKVSWKQITEPAKVIPKEEPKQSATKPALPANYPASKIPKLQNQSEKCYAIKFPYKLPKLQSQKRCKLPPAPLLQNYHCCHRRQCCPCCKLPEKSNRRPLALRNINYRHDAVLCRCQITPTIRVSAMLSSINHLQVCCFVRVSCSSYNRAFSYAGLHNHLPGVLTIEIVASNQRTLLVDWMFSKLRDISPHKITSRVLHVARNQASFQDQ